MTDLIGLYNQLIAGSFLFILEQIILLISVYRDDAGWHFRFSTLEDYTNLRPVQSTLKIALIIFTICLVVVPATGYFIFDSLVNYVKSLQYNFLVLVSALIGAFFLIWHYVVGKEWNNEQILIIIIEFVLLGILFYINYFK